MYVMWNVCNVELKNIDVRHGLKDLWDKVNKLTKRRTSPSTTATVTALDLNALR